MTPTVPNLTLYPSSINDYQSKFLNSKSPGIINFHSTLTVDLENFVSDIHTQLNSVKKLRMDLYKQIQIIAKEAFDNEFVSLQIFGSIATGLALPSSDMDISISGLKMFGDRNVLLEYMETLNNKLSSLDCIQQKLLISTATVPVIKLVYLLYNAIGS